MTLDIEKLARDAGADYAEYGINCIKGMKFYNMASLERFAALVLEQAAQECIAVCTDDKSAFGDGYNLASLDCEAAIRSMKPKAE